MTARGRGEAARVEREAVPARQRPGEELGRGRRDGGLATGALDLGMESYLEI